MTNLSEAISNETSNLSYTENGAATHASSKSACLDFFVIAPTIKHPERLIKLFDDAYAVDHDTTTRILLWLRDARGGAGMRNNFRICLDHLSKIDPEMSVKVLNKTPEVGRWDDVLTCLQHPMVGDHVVNMIRKALEDQNGLAAKWMPRKGEDAVALRNGLGWSPKFYRKTLVNLSNIVEHDICANLWDKVEYSKVPSLAMIKYNSAFHRHDHERFNEYIESVSKGKAKLNASVVFPHEVVHAALNEKMDALSCQNTWNNLASAAALDNTLVVADVSGSMDGTPMEVSVALAMLSAERMTGQFKNQFITFSNHPEFIKIDHSIDFIKRVRAIMEANWTMNTDIEATFDLIINSAISNHVPQEEMPKNIVIISDMEFDSCASGRSTHAFDMMREKYESNGYTLPNIVFWNVRARVGNSPVTYGQSGTGLIGGYSPSIMDSVINHIDDMTPMNIMMGAIMKERYNVN